MSQDKINLSLFILLFSPFVVVFIIVASRDYIKHFKYKKCEKILGVYNPSPCLLMDHNPDIKDLLAYHGLPTSYSSLGFEIVGDWDTYYHAIPLETLLKLAEDYEKGTVGSDLLYQMRKTYKE